MSDLNLNFDTGIKSVTMGGDVGKDNINISSNNNSPQLSPQPKVVTEEKPNLSVSDPVGIEFLAKNGSNNVSNEGSL